MSGIERVSGYVLVVRCQLVGWTIQYVSYLHLCLHFLRIVDYVRNQRDVDVDVELTSFF